MRFPAAVSELMKKGDVFVADGAVVTPC